MKEEIETVEVNSELVFHTMQTAMQMIALIATTAYPEANVANRHIVFCRNVATNLVCNFVMQMTDHSVANALDENMKVLLNDIKQWFDEIKIKKELVKKEMN